MTQPPAIRIDLLSQTTWFMHAALPAADAHLSILILSAISEAPPYLWWWQSQQQLSKRLLPAAAAFWLLCVAAEESICLCCIAAELRQPLAA
jgi:hypothetical protein